LRVPKWKPCAGAHEQIKNATALLAPPRLAMAD
jgi:hypothetical protein